MILLRHKYTSLDVSMQMIMPAAATCSAHAGSSLTAQRRKERHSAGRRWLMASAAVMMRWLSRRARRFVQNGFNRSDLYRH
jgi:hypothetical protein